MRKWRQQEFTFRTRGGRRRGAGRKSARFRGAVPHSARPEHKKAHPVHITLRASRRLPSLRRQVVFLEIRRALGRTARSWFRLVHFSVQTDHLHLLVEAADKSSLSRGLMGLSIRVARAVNRTLKRTGRVWDDRFHARALTSPLEVARHRVRSHEREETPSSRSKRRPLLVRQVFHGLENTSRAGSAERS